MSGMAAAAHAVYCQVALLPLKCMWYCRSRYPQPSPPFAAAPFPLNRRCTASTAPTPQPPGERIQRDFGLPNLVRFPIVPDLSAAGDGEAGRVREVVGHLQQQRLRRTCQVLLYATPSAPLPATQPLCCCSASVYPSVPPILSSWSPAPRLAPGRPPAGGCRPRLTYQQRMQPPRGSLLYSFTAH